MKRLLMLCLIIGLMLGIANQALAQEPEFEPFVQSDFNILTGDVQRPNGLFWHDDFIYTSCAGDWTLYRIHDTTGETITYIFGVKNSHSLYVESDEDGGTDVWVADFQDNKFAVINPEDERGIFPVRDGLANPWGLTPSAIDDSFFMTEWGSDNLLNISRTGDIQVVAGGFDDPSGVVSTEDSLYVANNGSARRAVEWLDMSGESGDVKPQPLVTGLQNVTNLVMGPDNLLYIAYALGTRGVVGRIDPTTCKESGCTNVDVDLVVWTELSAPLAGLLITPDMRLYVHTQFGSEIYWLDLTQARGTGS